MSASSAQAAEGGPQWTVTAVSLPTNFCPAATPACAAAAGGGDSYRVVVTNTGGEASDGSPVTVSDALPLGLSLDSAGASGVDELTFEEDRDTTNHVYKDPSLSCVILTCTYAGVVAPGDSLVLTFPVDVLGGAGGSVTNTVRVEGGGAVDAAVSTPTAINTKPAGFGISAGGASTAFSSLQAGAHPDFTTSIAFNTLTTAGALAGGFKDTSDELPPGFAGDLVDTPSCPVSKFALQECQIGAQVGDVTLILDISGKQTVDILPVYNLTPNPGEVAKVGFQTGGLQFQGAVSVRPGDYGLTTTFFNSLSESISEVDDVTFTIWGVPADPIHDPLRFQPMIGKTGLSGFGVASDAASAPFFTNPTSCGGGPLEAKFIVNSWERPEEDVEARMGFGPFIGCDRLSLPTEFTATPTTTRSYAPTGLDVKLLVHQTYDNAYGLATSTLKRAVVTLPEGMTVNPSAGAGLGSCAPAQLEEERLTFTPGQGCPTDAKLGSVRVKTPAVQEEGTGSVYIAQPYANPFDSLLALYIVVRFPERGIVVKLAGKIVPDPVTGRLISTFEGLPPQEGLPPVPFSSFTFSFRQGETSPLVTPPACGEYQAQAQLNPWSNPVLTLTDLTTPFLISEGATSSACPAGGTPPFAPQVSAGTQNNEASSYSPFYLRIERRDGEQEITGFSTQLPPGLTGNLSGIPFCSEADIAHARAQTGAEAEAAPACPAASQIGTTIAEAGVGTVLAQTPGKLYLAGPFEGAPFSVLNITSAKVGPFDLGTVVVHLRCTSTRSPRR